jgi:hypothetical protein|tara:strand:+ start:5510 stop:5806 length:297 start_codon:yes stop_codon:yes gene_type:complete
MTILETRVQKVAKANGLKDFKSTISFGELYRVQNLFMDVFINELDRTGYAFKCDLSGKACDVIVENNIPFMPYGHAIVTEAMAELNLMYDESSNAFAK